MLLGVLVDVIGAVASTEKQKIEISYIVGQLREELDKLSIIPEETRNGCNWATSWKSQKNDNFLEKQPN